MEHKLRFVTLRPEDYIERMSGSIVDLGVSNGYFDIKAQFDQLSGRNGSQYFNGMAAVIEDTARKYIQLAKPVLNPLYRRVLLSMFHLLYPDKDGYEMIKDILEFKQVLSKSGKKLVTPSHIEDAEDMIAGPELLRMYLHRFETEDLRIKSLSGLMSKYFKEFPGKVVKTKTDYLLIGDYYFEPKDKGLNLVDNFALTFNKKLTASEKSCLAYILAMTKDDIDTFFLFNLSVIPEGCRPTSDKERVDQLSAQYDDILKANSKLREYILHTFSGPEVVAKYQVLNKAVRDFLVFDNTEEDKEDIKRGRRKKKYRSIKVGLASKSGRIREYMLGKRQDFSGRSVIIANPEMGICEVGIPKDMLPDLFRYHYFKRCSQEDAFRFFSKPHKDQVDLIIQSGVLDEVYVTIGRQPTLHRVSMQAYRVIPVDGRAIEVNPLVSDAYNADFDGDQMHVEVPLSDEAVAEVRDLMASKHNLFKPSDGSPLQVPRLEMLLGLYIATRAEPVGPSTGEYRVTGLFDGILNQRLNVDTVVTLVDNQGKRYTSTAGRCLIYSQVSKAVPFKDVSVINKKSIKKYVAALYRGELSYYEVALKALCDIGFIVAKLYTPKVSLLDPINREALKGFMDAFEAEIAPTKEMYKAGFESESSYRQIYATTFKKYEDLILESLKEALPKDNGFRVLAESGARDSWPNIMQIYSHKGLIAKADGTSFNIVIKDSLASQMSPTAHFISAYGARKGSLDKNLKPGDTGYFERKLWHAANDIVITSQDCGTTEGIVIRKQDFVAELLNQGKTSAEVNAELKGLMADTIVGRYEAGAGGRYIDAALAEELSDREEVVIRSPIKCKNPCCAKCYGKDLSIQGPAVVGTAVGVLAAQSIGEPSTQLVMKSFHSGGVAGRSQIDSVFTIVSRMLEKQKVEYRDTYCPIAWVDGKVIKNLDQNTPGRIVVQIEGSPIKVNLPGTAVLKDAVKRGETMRLDAGTISIEDVERALGIDGALEYIARAVYLCYRSDGKVNLKHFEVIAASMRIYRIINAGSNSKLQAGCTYNAREIAALGGLRDSVYTESIVGVDRVPFNKYSPVSNILMEDILSGLSRAVLLKEEEDFGSPLNAVAFGIQPKVGTYYPNYIENRLKAERTLL